MILIYWMCTVTSQPIIIIAVADMMVTCCYFHSSSFIFTLTPHTHFLSNKCIICLYVQCKTHLLTMAVVGVRCYFKGFHRLIWQLCRVHNRQLDPRMMQSQTHSTSTVPSLSFSFIPLIDVFSIFISHFYPFCFCVRFSLFSLCSFFFFFFSCWDTEINAFQSFLYQWMWEHVPISAGFRAVVCTAGLHLANCTCRTQKKHIAPAEPKCISSVQLLSDEGKLYIGLRV